MTTVEPPAQSERDRLIAEFRDADTPDHRKPAIMRRAFEIYYDRPAGSMKPTDRVSLELQAPVLRMLHGDKEIARSNLDYARTAIVLAKVQGRREDEARARRMATRFALRVAQVARETQARVPTTPVIETASEPRSRERHTCAHTRRGPPSADDSSCDPPAERQSQRSGRVPAQRDYTTTPLTWKGIGRVTLSLAGVTARHGRVRIPYRLADGTEHNARLIAGSRCWWEQRGLELVPFGLEQLPSAARAARSVLFIAEGESDALTIRDQVAEHDDRTAYAIGLPGAGTWRPEWASIAARFERVYLVPDADEAGERMARMVLADVEWARRVCLPTGEDTRSVVRSYGVGRFCSFIDQADRDAALWDAIRTADTLAEFEAILGRRTA